MSDFKEKFDQFMSQFDSDFQMPHFSDYMGVYNPRLDLMVYRRSTDNGVHWAYALSAAELKMLTKEQLKAVLDEKFNSDTRRADSSRGASSITMPLSSTPQSIVDFIHGS